ncbi:MAG: M14 family zinc carboxypeptidase [Vicinamibacteria bacterium]
MLEALFILTVAAQSAALSGPETAQSLAREHESRRFVTVPAPCFTPGLLAQELARLVTARPQVTVEVVGTSFLGKEIRMMSIGRGSKSILLWSQMHGDEPSATPALLDLADFLAREEKRPDIARILDTFTLRMIPQLNPDGSEAYERRNAQGIDINRDALMLTTPEGRLLKSIRDRYSPILGFNLHDQNRRTMVGETGVISSISLLAVSGDAQGTITDGRLRAKRVASHIVRTLTPFIPGGIARYDEDWNPRAFGDNVTAWGSPVVLIESGGFPRGGGFRDLTRLNFVALVSILDGLSRDDLADETPALYDELLRNQSDAYADIAIVGASILEPRSQKWFDADVAFDRLESDQAVSGCSAVPRAGSRVIEVGDSRLVTPGRRIDGKGMLLAPLSRDRKLKPGEISRARLLATRPGSRRAAIDPREMLMALKLSEGIITRGGSANFVAWIGDPENPSNGRYFAVVDGVGLPDSLK